MTLVSIAIVDDQPLMVEALKSLLSQNIGYDVVATGTSVKDIYEISSKLHPQIIIVDLNLIDDVYDAIAKVVKLTPATKVIAFTAVAGVEFPIRALDAGAKAYVLKRDNPHELIRAVETVLAKETYITQYFASKVITALRDTSLRQKAAAIVKFSIREEQIVQALLRGGTNKQIAFALKISEKTVKHYMTILMLKLNARNRVEVVIAAQKLGYEHPVMQ